MYSACSLRNKVFRHYEFAADHQPQLLQTPAQPGQRKLQLLLLPLVLAGVSIYARKLHRTCLQRTVVFRHERPSYVREVSGDVLVTHRFILRALYAAYAADSMQKTVVASTSVGRSPCSNTCAALPQT